MHRTVRFENVLKLVRELSTVEKVRLIERVAPEIERELITSRVDSSTSMLGLVKDLGPAPSASEIDVSRREAWANFPRDGA